MVPPDRARLGGAPHHVRPEAEGVHQLGIRARGKATAADAPPALPRAVDAAVPALHLLAHARRARGPVRRALRTTPPSSWTASAPLTLSCGRIPFVHRRRAIPPDTPRRLRRGTGR